MKKLITIFLALILVISMAACDKTSTQDTNPAETTGNHETNVTEDTNENTSATEDEGTTPTTPGNENETDATQPTTPSENTSEGVGPTDRDDGSETKPTTGETTTPTQPTETTKPPAGATDVTEPTHTHEYSSKVTKATCTTDGYTKHTCSCGASYTDSTTKATGHSFGEWKTTKEPTTSATGTAERKCNNCSEKETKTLGKLVESHKHSYTSKVTKTATCKAEGVKTYTCSCGDTYTESIAKAPHKYTDKVTKPTCTNGGYTTHTCSECGNAYSDTQTSALGHAYSAVKQQSPTCTEQGYTLYECSRCKASYKDNVKPAAGHDYDVTSNTATCTTGGKKTETCYFCGDKKVTNSSAKGHGTTRTETKEATTSAAGYTRVICNDCNGVLSETVIPKLEPPHTCADNMKRINCKDLKDNAVGWYTENYRTYTQCSIMACSICGKADTSTLNYIYTSAQATAKIIEMINAERYRVYGTHEYDIVVATHHSAAEWGAKYIVNDFQHCTPFRENIYQGGMSGDMIARAFNWWMNSPTHYNLMIDKNVKYASLGVYVNEDVGFYTMLIMWDKDELYLDNPNYTWECR